MPPVWAVDKSGRGSSWAFLSGGLLLLAQPPFGFILLPFLALVPFLVGLGSIPAGAQGGRKATTLGVLFGGVYWGFALVWVPLSVGPHFPWAFPGYLLLLLILGGLSGAFGWAAHHLHRGRGLPLSLAVPVAWVGVEWLKSHFPLGLSFPWLGLGVTLAEWPEFLVLAELGGEGAVAFWLAGVNALVAEVVLGTRSRASLRQWTLIAALILLPSVGGWIRADSLPLEEGPLVLAVGTGASSESAESRTDDGLEALIQIRREISGLEPGSVDLVVLPEGLIPLPLSDQEAGDAGRFLRDLVAEVGSPVAFGALGRKDPESAGSGLTNSAYLMSVDGEATQRYDKVRLVPGMEAGSYVSGREGETFRLAGWVAAPLICYESLFSGAARKGRRAGAHFLVNLSSDIWFGREGSWLGSLFLHQHPAHLVLRAVETRTSVVRAAKGGFTLILDPAGREIAQGAPPGGGSVQGRLPVFRGSTVFFRTGDWVGPGSLALCLMLLGASFWVGRMERKGAGQPRPWIHRPGPG